jgi:amino acid adenylation domain-containing protein
MSLRTLDCAKCGVDAPAGATTRNVLNEQDRIKVLLEWNNTASDFPENHCIHELFSEQASKTPLATAVVMGDLCLTYADLDRRTNQVAHYLRSIGVGGEATVGLCIERSLEMIVGLLSILKAGGAYLPIDKADPPERISYLINDAGASVCLTDAETSALLVGQGLQIIILDIDSDLVARQPESAPISGVNSNNLAYVMYTSGSSGRPKGVGVVHYNISRLIKNTNYVQITADDVFLQLAPVTFDAATFEIWGALLNGATLVLYPPDAIIDLVKLKTLIRNAEVSILWLTAGLFHTIVDCELELLTPIKQLLVGGDVVSATHMRKCLERLSECRVINGYGPTEGTTFSICFQVPNISAVATTVPIGRPVSNTTAYVLDANLEPVAIGETGELYIGGAGLSRGYLKRPNLTAGLFIPDPFGPPGSRLYRTGDLVRYCEDALLLFIGRKDFQVKVNGYRIELEEVEAVIRSDQSIRDVVVMPLQGPKGDKRLAAYVVGANENVPDVKRLRQHLNRQLPDYMVPSIWHVLPKLPLTANGKVDRKALPEPEDRSEPATLRERVEGTIAEIWALILGVRNVDVEDDFFDLGGTSLGLINVVAEMSKRFGLPLDTSVVTRGATVRALAQAVQEWQVPGPSLLECPIVH